MTPAPIILFVYNRPEHTRRTIEALQANALAAQSVLTVFSDGPRSPVEQESVAEVRAYLRNVRGFERLTVVEQEKNLGLARSIIDGVSTALAEADRVIVLEDDIVTSPCFLRYMNDALEFYREEERVMHVSGHMFPVASDDLPQSVFLRPASCWGWGTWARAWRHFAKDPEILVRKFDSGMKKSFNLDGAYDYWSHVLLNRRGRIDTWAIFWYASVFLQGGLCLHPARSLTDNIGHDGSGVHCHPTEAFQVNLSAGAVTEFPKEIIEHPEALMRVQAFYRSQRVSLWQRVVRKGRKMLDHYDFRGGGN
ncbi:sugar transferase [Trichloromonas sp.]|uniref:sugar transferase n=1 Tax=Trichloromonas sp. TaxID=3069249 RepID=UPI003D812CEB